ncbi:uncharacterized protein BBA_00578 [Beauveria bassiana ARSEF 2860]|uniref:Uncharacterized protein n=1 Tax=Beauveria bassiana (strain ARSEF 2860) TaxID=655819 RepID=J5K3N5_BEAB2|nr:uncharacterized protein BBA_00578 [Beauveria bassiana ARSEF 2860]EJP70948.1 hypothetical protein BBA_00578 [Beauveria bassiana ARSEF 2860]
MRSAALLLGLCAWSAAAAKATHSTVLYQQFFPAWDEMLKGYLEHNCQENITNYRNASFNDTHISYAVFDCLLQQFPEFRKSELGAAAVVLGLAPSILQMVSPTPADTAMLSLRRPVLALLLSVASPATIFSTAAIYADKVEALSKPLSRQARGSFPYTAGRLFGHGFLTLFLSAMQYLLALAAVANSAYRTYQLCVWTVCSFSPITVFLPALWHGTVVLLHLSGWVALRLNVQSAERVSDAKRAAGHHRQDTKAGWASRLKSCIENETTPSAFAEKLPVESRAAGPAPFFSAVIAALYAGAPVHLLYGTLVLSSLTFISAFDSIAVVAFYAMSTIVSKAILYFECAGIQAVASQDLEATTEGEQMNGYSTL